MAPTAVVRPGKPLIPMALKHETIDLTSSIPTEADLSQAWAEEVASALRSVDGTQPDGTPVPTSSDATLSRRRRAGISSTLVGRATGALVSSWQARKRGDGAWEVVTPLIMRARSVYGRLLDLWSAEASQRLRDAVSRRLVTIVRARAGR